MIIDTSALMSILQNEPDRAAYVAALDHSDASRISAATLVELTAVCQARLPVLESFADALIAEFGVVTEPVTAGQATIARQAYRTYGRGSGHPARLNLGDCFSYALAKDLDLPLLFKGEGFGHTDVRSAL